MWTSTSDNFLYQKYGIFADSPIVIGFLTTWTDDENGQPLHGHLLFPLLGMAGASTAGWVGFTDAGDDFGGWGASEMFTQLYSKDVPEWASKTTAQTKKSAKQSCSASGIAVSGVSGTLGGAGVGAMIGSAVEPGIGTAIGALIGGLAGGGASSTAEASKEGCI